MDYIASVVRGREVIEIGTRAGDHVHCLSRHASRATAVEIEPKYCPALRNRSRGRFAVRCPERFPADGAPADADFFYMWINPLAHCGIMRALRRLADAGRVRRSAQLLLQFDMQQAPPEVR
eukprot:gene9560-38449_t